MERLVNGQQSYCHLKIFFWGLNNHSLITPGLNTKKSLNKHGLTQIDERERKWRRYHGFTKCKTVKSVYYEASAISGATETHPSNRSRLYTYTLHKQDLLLNSDNVLLRLCWINVNIREFNPLTCSIGQYCPSKVWRLTT